MYNGSRCDYSNTSEAFSRGKESIKESLCLLMCVCPVTTLVSEVLNHDRNSRYLLMPAAPITREENTMVSMVTQTLASPYDPPKSSTGIKLRAHSTPLTACITSHLELRHCACDHVGLVIILWFLSPRLTKHRWDDSCSITATELMCFSFVISDVNSRGSSHI